MVMPWEISFLNFEYKFPLLDFLGKNSNWIKIALTSPNSALQEPLWNSLEFWFCKEQPTEDLVFFLLWLFEYPYRNNKQDPKVGPKTWNKLQMKQINHKNNQSKLEVSVHILIPKQHLLFGGGDTKAQKHKSLWNLSRKYDKFSGYNPLHPVM